MMRLGKRNIFLGLWMAVSAAMLLASAGCDSVQPTEDPRLVVEAFLDTGKPLPGLTLRRTMPLGIPYTSGDGITDATVLLTLDGQPIRYVPEVATPGRYTPVGPGRMVAEGAAFSLDVQWRDQAAAASGTVPPPIHLDSVRVEAPDKPVRAVLLDSLDIRFDSLDVGARQGFLYPVEVTLWWKTKPGDADPDFWIETQLQPRTTFSSEIVDFFLLPAAVFLEDDAPRDALGRRRWTGVYAVPVAAESDPLPVHELKAALLRSGSDYARFATSRDDPQRREPVSNVDGGIGIVAGISVDSMRVEVRRKGSFSAKKKAE